MTIHKATTITIIMQALTTTQHIDSWCQIVLDLLDLTLAELFYGFYKEHLETRNPVDYHNYQVISIYLNGNSDNFCSLNFSPLLFLQ